MAAKSLGQWEGVGDAEKERVSVWFLPPDPTPTPPRHSLVSLVGVSSSGPETLRAEGPPWSETRHTWLPSFPAPCLSTTP